MAELKKLLEIKYKRLEGLLSSYQNEVFQSEEDTFSLLYDQNGQKYFDNIIKNCSVEKTNSKNCYYSVTDKTFYLSLESLRVSPEETDYQIMTAILQALILENNKMRNFLKMSNFGSIYFGTKNKGYLGTYFLYFLATYASEYIALKLELNKAPFELNENGALPFVKFYCLSTIGTLYGLPIFHTLDNFVSSIIQGTFIANMVIFFDDFSNTSIMAMLIALTEKLTKNVLILEQLPVGSDKTKEYQENVDKSYKELCEYFVIANQSMKERLDKMGIPK